ncbi:MAG TPA: phosphatase PAP2 family protein, partial [Anaerolineae bacterium]|nr:phosphatase PAP2 family protein [Anaerolineae bacterium]
MILVGGLTFGAIALSLQTNGSLPQTDVSLENAIHVMALHSSPFLRSAMIVGFYVGEHIIAVIGIVLALYFLHKRFWPEFSMVVIAWVGEGALWLFLSTYFNRARPSFDVPVWHVMTVPTFPSGHSIAAVMCFGFLTYLLLPRMPSRFWKGAVVVTAVSIILYIGFSRIFVGDHYLTDVLAGYALGLAWFGLVFTTIEFITQKRKKE